VNSRLNFVRQQGLREATPEICDYQYPALKWQPRAIGALVLIGVAFQAWPCFALLSAVLWWNVVFPRLNPFDALYNFFVARPRKLPRLGPAPHPRRFGAQAMAGTFMLAIALCLLASRHGAASVLEAVLLAALAALIFGRFCLGSYLFLVFTGQGAFASRTLPWSHTD
jgi:hypothetical protein